MSYKGPIEIEMPLFSSKEWHEKDGHRCENLKKFTIATHDKGKKKINVKPLPEPETRKSPMQVKIFLSL